METHENTQAAAFKGSLFIYHLIWTDLGFSNRAAEVERLSRTSMCTCLFILWRTVNCCCIADSWFYTSAPMGQDSSCLLESSVLSPGTQKWIVIMLHPLSLPEEPSALNIKARGGGPSAFGNSLWNSRSGERVKQRGGKNRILFASLNFPNSDKWDSGLNMTYGG